VSEDLRALREAGFTGLVTYGSNLRQREDATKPPLVPRLAEQAGFGAVIVGVWDPNDEGELRVAADVGLLAVVLGYSVGNEGLGARYDLGQLSSAMQRLRRLTTKPVTTSEESGDYYENSPLWQLSDWLFPNVHPYFANQHAPGPAAAWTERVFASLSKLSDKPLLFKEVGLPSVGEGGASEQAQAEYYRLLGQTRTQYVVFEAFDAEWKRLPGARRSASDPEAHWGIFASTRQPKPAAAVACRGRESAANH
jgi:exo-beta-1,3-glucanase (GH17 family)